MFRTPNLKLFVLCSVPDTDAIWNLNPGSPV
jgi:hypothetical protein